jgi:hypothetical protein
MVEVSRATTTVGNPNSAWLGLRDTGFELDGFDGDWVLLF